MDYKTSLLLLLPYSVFAQIAGTTNAFTSIRDEQVISYSAGDVTGFSNLSGVDSDTLYEVTADSVFNYNHHPYVFLSGSGVVYAMHSTHNFDEEGPGQFTRYTYSANGGDTWASIDTLITSQSNHIGRTESIDGRVTIPCGFVEVNDSVYALIDVNDRFWSTNGNRQGVGVLAIYVNSDQVGTPVWIANTDQTQTAPDSFAVGYPSYEFDAELSGEIFNELYSPDKASFNLFSNQYDSLWHTRRVAIDGQELTEPAAVKLPDGNWLKLWRAIGGDVGKKYAQFSSDGGINWSDAIKTNIPDWEDGNSSNNISGNRTELLLGSNGVVYAVGTGNTGSARNPQVIWKSSDGGYTYNEGWVIYNSSDLPAWSGEGHNPGPQYVDCTELENGKIICIFSVAKEHIVVSKFDKP